MNVHRYGYRVYLGSFAGGSQAVATRETTEASATALQDFAREILLRLSGIEVGISPATVAPDRLSVDFVVSSHADVDTVEAAVQALCRERLWSAQLRFVSRSAVALGAKPQHPSRR